MKKLVLMLAAASMAASVSAQTVAESKTFDNIYVGINGGVATKTTGHKWLSDLDPNAGLRIGRYFTPVFGLAIEGNAYFSNKPWGSTGTVVRATNASLLGTVNLSNWFGGYKGEPRTFEVSALYGLGWMHVFTNNKAFEAATSENRNRMTSKAALDFAFNFGSAKQFQFYVEPSINFAFLGKSHSHNVAVTPAGVTYPETSYGYGYKATAQAGQPAYNINNSFVQLNAGLVYKFANSNGTHNFTIVTPRDQAEIDALNAQINELRNRKPEVITKEVVKEVPSVKVKELSVSDLVFVTFAQGKSNLTREAKAALNNVKEGSHVQVVGTASPEGSKEINDRLSQARADVVANYLKSRGVNIDDATGKGVQGVTSNRLAVVYVK
ncbi:OmpA family protein [Prevotella histicola]|jgi:outer membrane protein OmpA-like peptidoglycan-associated protein|uniref:OmpA family protein n=2 Tax=Prevotella histicola TaxID=470565 RepID=A0AAW3FHX0_9BACT|nr:OmpA family protein [Prevotella histicola]KGF29580.1 OmpA family protein [Prevotella histicola JCM 15637 = DNF00424]MBF1410710.1 OmpA family protein [Prevotella histicola]MBF1425232.1 OmpA family protein [Prevotella histicola]MBS6661130.1 OmpA family protein [Prevotella histicola]MBW4711063.1 OmpA family protein [Prevotella histicola]